MAAIVPRMGSGSAMADSLSCPEPPEGAILAPGKTNRDGGAADPRREQETDFPIYHGVLNRAVWSSRAMAGWPLRLLSPASSAPMPLLSRDNQDGGRIASPEMLPEADPLPHLTCSPRSLGAEMGQISMATRDELVGALAARYGASNRFERGRILDEFVAVSGLHRKHAMRLLRAGQREQRSGPRPARRLYDEAVREALIVIWEASDRICGKRLRALVPILVEAMERHGHLQLTPEVRTGLQTMSAATIDRALREVRGAGADEAPSCAAFGEHPAQRAGANL